MSKVAIVTGANKGIGFHIARKLLRHGLVVYLACRNEALAAAAAELLVKELLPAVPPMCLPFDLEAPATFAECSKKFIEQEHKRLGPEAKPTLDVLVHNAGFAFHHDAPEGPYIQASKTMTINYFGTCQANSVLSPLLNPQSGRIILVTSRAGNFSRLGSKALVDKLLSPTLHMDELNSIASRFVELQKIIQEAEDAGRKPPPEVVAERNGYSDSNYGVSKAMLNAYVQMQARALSGSGSSVTINVCCPGYCDTDMTTHMGPRPAEDGADTPFWLAVSEEVAGHSGEFFGERKSMSFVNAGF